MKTNKEPFEIDESVVVADDIFDESVVVADDDDDWGFDVELSDDEAAEGGEEE